MNKLYRTIVIDDEPPARIRMLNLLANFPETFDVIAEAKDGVEAIEKIEDLNPDLIFLDIEMPEISGFEMLKKITRIPIVIFCTAYDQYSLQAFETNSIDYLVKPVSVDRLQQSVNKLKLFGNNKASQNILKMLNEISSQKEEKLMTSMTVKKGDKLIFVKLEEVSHFTADDRYVSLHTNQDSYLIEDSLTKLIEILPSNFLRVHRSSIINTNYVKEVQKYFNSRYTINLNNSLKTNVITGRSYNDAIKKWMEI